MTPAASLDRRHSGPGWWRIEVTPPDPAVPIASEAQKRCHRDHRLAATAPCPACGWTPSGLASRSAT